MLTIYSHILRLNGRCPKCKKAIEVCVYAFGMRGCRARFGQYGESGGTVQTHGMMCDIFVQVRQHQQQIQHPLALLGNGITHFLLQILDN